MLAWEIEFRPNSDQGDSHVFSWLKLLGKEVLFGHLDSMWENPTDIYSPQKKVKLREGGNQAPLILCEIPDPVIPKATSFSDSISLKNMSPMFGLNSFGLDFYH